MQMSGDVGLEPAEGGSSTESKDVTLISSGPLAAQDGDPEADAASQPVSPSRSSSSSSSAGQGLSRAAPPPPVPHPAPGTYASPLSIRFELPGGDPDTLVFATSSPHEPAACGQVVAPGAPLVLQDPSAEDGMSGSDLAAADAWLVARLGGGGGTQGRSGSPSK